MSGLPLAAALASLGAMSAVGTIATAPGSERIGRIDARTTSPRHGRLRRVLRRAGGSRLGRMVPRARLATLVAAAHADWLPDEIAGAKVLATGALLACAIAAAVPLLALPIGVVAWRVPEIVLGRRARRRASDAASEAPLFLDLLAVACSAGLAPQLAVSLAAEPLHGPLAVELGDAITRSQLGRRWRDEVSAVADRLELTDLRRAAAVLGRSEALGSSLADEMARLAADVRESRRSRATERARTAPVKMLFPLVFLILPAFLLLTVVPVLLSTVRSIG